MYIMCKRLIYSVCLILLAGQGLYGSPQPDMILYDDGNPLRMDINQNALFAVRFTPDRPFNLMAVYLMVRNDYNTTDGCKVWVAQNNGGLPAWPAIYVGQVPAPLPDQQWVQFDLAGLMYFEDDFFIVAQQKGGPYPGDSFWIGIDYGTTTGRTVKSYSDGQGWLDEPLGDATIRAVGIYATVQATKATNPYPANSATDVPTNVTLSWTPGYGAAWHDVFFGTDPTAVADADTTTIGIYRSRQIVDVNSYDPGALDLNKNYYWRIDEIEADGIRHPGDIWSFTTTDIPGVGPAGRYGVVYDPAGYQVVIWTPTNVFWSQPATGTAQEVTADGDSISNVQGVIYNPNGYQVIIWTPTNVFWSQPATRTAQEITANGASISNVRGVIYDPVGFQTVIWTSTNVYWSQPATRIAQEVTANGAPISAQGVIYDPAGYQIVIWTSANVYWSQPATRTAQEVTVNGAPISNVQSVIYDPVGYQVMIWTPTNVFWSQPATRIAQEVTANGNSIGGP